MKSRRKAWLAAAAGGLALVVVAGGVALYRASVAPIDDPSYFCEAPDPTPAAWIAATAILGNCAAGKTFTLEKGQAVAVDLPGGNGFDTSTQWTDLVVSDPHVLSPVLSPGRYAGVEQGRQDEVAVYRAIQSGQATLSAVQHLCTPSGTDSCSRGHLWTVTIRVS